MGCFLSYVSIGGEDPVLSPQHPDGHSQGTVFGCLCCSPPGDSQSALVSMGSPGSSSQAACTHEAQSLWNRHDQAAEPAESTMC